MHAGTLRSRMCAADRIVMDPDDVPTAVDFHDPAHARTWTDETPRKRPWRPQFFAAFCSALRDPELRILELGSGPGHLAREGQEAGAVPRSHRAARGTA
jgi:hypothetical protein